MSEKEAKVEETIPVQVNPKRNGLVVTALISVVVLLSLTLIFVSVFVFYYVKDDPEVENITGKASCSYEGKEYSNGSAVPSGDSCNTCSCSNGVVGCTLMACNPPGEGLDDASKVETVGNEMVYTNSFYPDLSIIYPKDWELIANRDRIEPESDTGSDYDNYYKNNEIYSYDIKLTKGNSELTYSIEGPILGGIGFGYPTCYTKYEKDYEMVGNGWTRVNDSGMYLYSDGYLDKSGGADFLDLRENGISFNDLKGDAEDYVLCGTDNLAINTSYKFIEQNFEGNPIAFIYFNFKYLGELDEKILLEADKIISGSTYKVEEGVEN